MVNGIPDVSTFYLLLYSLAGNGSAESVLCWTRGWCACRATVTKQHTQWIEKTVAAARTATAWLPASLRRITNKRPRAARAIESISAELPTLIDQT